MTHRLLPLAITIAILALAFAARAQPAPPAPPPLRPPLVLPAEEADRLMALLAEVPAKWSFDALQILLARRAATAPTAAQPTPEPKAN